MVCASPVSPPRILPMTLLLNEIKYSKFNNMDINLKNDAFSLVSVKSIDPEITGADKMDLNLEVPMGETTAKVNLKLTTTVASSILAQEKLNQIARDNIEFLGSKIAEGISYIMDNSYNWMSRVHEIEKLQKQWRDEERMAD